MKAQESLYTDRYELSMLDAALVSGVIDAHATFEVFTRCLPNGFRYGVVGGTGRFLEALADFSFDDETISWLVNERIVSNDLATFLSTYRFKGNVYGYSEGDVFTALSPILRIEGRFCDLILETLALSILNYDSGVATKAARVVHAAKGRRLIEMGSRRTNEAAAVAAARAAYVAGSTRPATWPPASSTACRPRGPRHTRSCWLIEVSAKRSRRRSAPRDRAPRCSSTPLTPRSVPN